MERIKIDKVKHDFAQSKLIGNVIDRVTCNFTSIFRSKTQPRNYNLKHFHFVICARVNIENPLDTKII